MRSVRYIGIQYFPNLSKHRPIFQSTSIALAVLRTIFQETHLKKYSLREAARWMLSHPLCDSIYFYLENLTRAAGNSHNQSPVKKLSPPYVFSVPFLELQKSTEVHEHCGNKNVSSYQNGFFPMNTTWSHMPHSGTLISTVLWFIESNSNKFILCSAL